MILCYLIANKRKREQPQGEGGERVAGTYFGGFCILACPDLSASYCFVSRAASS